ncbi:MAG: dihydroorotate dehydrogenase electron transfer subunit [Deltaproteobacteria bacterium]|nr:MAG: dihydroorotate dehydrogenase electron transfer subunit [Deltaproteobacteria bacterium]RKX59961.1 MAG: dihydroorotate dehydrogenase electron transfer subunit [Thermodesulfobacteriota bacterium]
MPRFDIPARIIEQIQLVHGIFLLTVKAPAILESASPGQFCMLEVKYHNSRDPLLRRPLSIYKTLANGRISFLYKEVGKGTRLLSKRCPGEIVRILGPLGQGFRLIRDRPCILVGGGLGIASLLLLAEKIKQSGKLIILLGAGNASEIPTIEDFSRLTRDFHIATEDGSLGQKGMVTDLLAQTLQKIKGMAQIYTCGPWPMMKAVYYMARNKNIPCQVSLEATMACGIGLCLGCAVPRSDSQGFLHVCREGPVFDADQVNWEYSQ